MEGKKNYDKIKVLYIISKKHIPNSFHQTRAHQFASLKGGIVSFTNTKCNHIIQYRILNSATHKVYLLTNKLGH
jgi:hypothetical protein